MKMGNTKLVIAVIMLVAVIAGAFFAPKEQEPVYSDSVTNVPEFTGNPYVIVDNNQPSFSESDYTTRSFEYYSSLDRLNRCGYAMACIGKDLMPTQDRESIGQIKPSGWQTVKYDFVDGRYLYNRCHLIGFQLTGENANECNLITGTRYMNVEGMLPFENLVADYIRETGNHVLYRVTPIFIEDELVARGVQMEGFSVEDKGDGICFNVYVYNSQPGVEIDYATGYSKQAQQSAPTDKTATYILNTNSKKFHDTSCALADNIKEENRSEYTGTRSALMESGYSPCGSCDP